MEVTNDPQGANDPQTIWLRNLTVTTRRERPKPLTADSTVKNGAPAR